jgi:HSP20 family protein
MQTYLWNPWLVFHELERAMLDTPAATGPVFEVEDTDDETILTADVPGLAEDDLELTVSGPIVTVRGERRPPEGRSLGRTRRYGAFERRFQLDGRHDLDSVRAHLANGVLTIRIAKAEAARPRRIKLTTGVIDRVRGLLTGDKDKQRAA